MAELSSFTPLATFLRPPRAATPEPELIPAAPASIPLPVECVEALSAARRFRAGLCDALDVAVTKCLQEIVREVLARELRLSPPDLAAVVEAALDRRANESVLAIRANPADLEALRALGLELLADEALSPGDAEIVLRSGTIDLALAARIDKVLALWNA